MIGFKFHIRYPDGKAEHVAVEADRALIGSGAHCEIRLPIDQAAVEHVAVQLGANGAFAEARSFDPAPTLNGMPFTAMQIPPGGVLGIGQCQIELTVAEAAQSPIATKTAKSSSPLIYLFALIAVPVCLYIIMADDPRPTVAAPPKEAPPLFGPAVTACPLQSAEQAGAFAHDKKTLANTKRERRPFRVQEGVGAVPLYEVASACFAIAGQPILAKEASEAANTLRNQVDDDYRTHRVRLEHALSVQDFASAHKEVNVLLAFNDGKQNEYVVWLSNLERQLQVKYGSKLQ